MADDSDQTTGHEGKRAAIAHAHFIEWTASLSDAVERALGELATMPDARHLSSAERQHLRDLGVALTKLASLLELSAAPGWDASRR
jgi:hypothetical protein